MSRTVHRSYRIPVDINVRVMRLRDTLRASRPKGIPPTCQLTETDVVALALDRGLTVLEAEAHEADTK